jgi:hypothetical protein
MVGLQSLFALWLDPIGGKCRWNDKEEVVFCGCGTVRYRIGVADFPDLT